MHVFINKSLIAIVFWIMFRILKLMSVPEAWSNVVFVKAIFFLGADSRKGFQGRQSVSFLAAFRRFYFSLCQSKVSSP